MIIEVHAKPLSDRESVKEISQNVFEIRVKEPPEKGLANMSVERLLAKHLGIPKSSVKVFRGTSSRKKLVKVE